MKKDFFDESFEEFLKRNADQLRMRPSEDVWQNIERQRARRRRRVGIGSTLFLLTASLFGYFSLNNSPVVSLKPVADQPITTIPGNNAAMPLNEASAASRPS